MSREPLPKKRKKKVNPCPNPLFVEWLTEWRDDAANKGQKTQYAYGKALSALKKYPMPLRSGEEAKMLDNFGAKICKMLDHKLATHVEVNVSEPSASTSWSSDHSSPSSRTSLPPQTSLVHVIPPALKINHGSKKTRVRQPSTHGPRDYVPAYRSGPYALLLTLHRQYQNPNSKGILTKLELQREAQPLSEKSFTVPDPGSHYTAWSSMSALISKGYVTKEGSPARYSITDSGCQLGNRLESVQAQFEPNAASTKNSSVGGNSYENKSQPRTGKSKRKAGTSRTDDEPCNIAHRTSSGPQQASTDNNKLSYWFITEAGEQVIAKDDAAVTVDDELGIGFLIKANEASLIASHVRYKQDRTRTTEGLMVYAYLHNDDAVNYCTPPTMLTAAPSFSSIRVPAITEPQTHLPDYNVRTGRPQSKAKPRKTPKPIDVDDECFGVGYKPSMSHGENQSSKLLPNLTSDSASTVLKQSSSLSSSRSSSTAGTRDSNRSGHSTARSVESLSECSRDSYRTLDGERHPQGGVAPMQSSADGVSLVSASVEGRRGSEALLSTTRVRQPPEPLFVLQPGTFDIVLCVDNCETSGGSYSSASRKQLLLPQLQRNGVNLDVRRLQVGDFLWVAREKRVPVPGRIEMPPGREVVLDYVVERKRMDDLCGSITDGRFKEQKFRLKQSGLRKPIYLIEDYGSIEHLSLPASTLKQAIVNTQVIDGFFVKHTRDNRESAAYLTVMTRYLQGHYSDKILEAYRREDLEHCDCSLSNEKHQLMSFQECSQSSVKNKNTTVTETFAKQLLQFSGLTAEKALAIIQQYPTPSELFAAYEACSTEKDQEKLLAHMKFGKLHRNMGPVLSRMMYMLYCTDGPLS